MPSPDADLAVALDSALSTLTLNANLFVGPVRPVGADVPAAAVFCLLTGGPGPSPYLGTAEDLRRYGVQVRVRVDAGDGYAAGRDFALSVLQATQRLAVSGYVSCLVQGELGYLGQDEQANFEWSFNVQLLRVV